MFVCRLVLLLSCLVVVFPLFSDGVPPNGSGTASDPYQIATLDNLLWLSTTNSVWSCHYVQTSDIDASDTANWNDGEGFLPIGTTDNNFTGVYHGQGYSITDLYINRPAEVRQALFQTTIEATLSDLHLVNANITGYNGVAALIGYSNYNTHVVSCSSSGVITCMNYSSGGLIGAARYCSSIERCSSTAQVHGEYYTGGFIGHVYESVITDCFCTGDVDGYQYCGGLVGWLDYSGIKRCYSAGHVSGDFDTYGFTGFQEESNIINSFWDMETSGHTFSQGCTGKTTAEMHDVATYTELTSQGLDSTWDFMWNPYDDHAYGDYWDIDDQLNGGYPYTFINTAYDGVQPAGSGTEDDPFQIEILDNLMWMGSHSEYWDCHFLQIADIDATDTQSWYYSDGFLPIGNADEPFTGVYDGQRYSISNLYINRPFAIRQAMFHTLYLGSRIRNLDLSDVNISGSNCSAAFAGKMDWGDELHNCSSSGIITSCSDGAGGLVGYMEGGASIDRCRSTAEVNGTIYVGGLAGYMKESSSITNSYCMGAVNGYQYVGGMVGWILSSTVDNCYSTGSVTGDYNAYGLIGNNINSPVNNSFWNVETSGQSSSQGGTGKTTAELQDVATYTDLTTPGLDSPWDFVDNPYDDNGYNSFWVLNAQENNGYPETIIDEICTGMQPVGSGTEIDPYQVQSLENLLWISDNPSCWNCHFMQIADIDARNTQIQNKRKGFNPIGGMANHFTGVYNGQGFAITNLYIDRYTANRRALFHSTTAALLVNIRLVHANITGANSTGTIVGYCTSGTQVINCSSSGIVTSIDEATGGLIGYASHGSIIKCCHSTVHVCGHIYAGGLVGYVKYSVDIRNCCSNGDVDGYYYTGGLIGWLQTATVDNCYSSGQVTSANVGRGMIGYANFSTITNSFWDTETSGQPTSAGGAGKTTAEMLDVATYTDTTSLGLETPWDFENDPFDDDGVSDYWKINPEMNNGYPTVSAHTLNYGIKPTGSGTSNDPYQIATLQHLHWMSLNPDKCDLNYIQTANIDASETQTWNSGKGFVPIGSLSTRDKFSGTYDGQGYCISDLFMNRPETIRQALFETTCQASISDLRLENVNVSGSNSTAALIGYAYSSTCVTGCSCSGTITSSSDGAGGLIGYAHTGTIIERCCSTAEVTGVNYVGGLVGYVASSSSILDCFSNGAVRGCQYSGGLIGWIASTPVNKCYSTGLVTSDSNAGGLIGYRYSGSVSNSFWNTETSGQSTSVGGTGKTTAEMQNVATYTSLASFGLDSPWDFVSNPNDDTGNEDIWNIDTAMNNGYPFLTWQTLIAPSPPENVAISIAGDTVTVTWQAVPIATSYTVYSSASPYGPFILDESGTYNGLCWSAPVAGGRKFYVVKSAIE